MKIKFTKISWEGYNYWRLEDKRIIKKINDLIKDIQKTPFEGKGKPEPLKFDLSGLWSRRLEREHRLVYKVEDKDILIYSCRYYCDK